MRVAVCADGCGAPGDIANGEVVAALTTYGSTASDSCDDGFVLHGVASVTCQPNGEWGARQCPAAPMSPPWSMSSEATLNMAPQVLVIIGPASNT